MLFLGDCIEIMSTLGDNSVDMVLADVPYGQTQNDWDVPIPFEPMWKQLRRVAKPNAAMVLMAAQPFASKLICSNLQDFRYDLIWKKNKPTGFLNAKKQPLRVHEHILVFYRKPPVFVPQMTNGHKPGNYARRTKHSTNYGSQTPTEYGGSTERYPTSAIEIPIINNDDPDKHHPTQKPVDLMAWLIRSYTKPEQVVLDFAAGSCTTALAAIREQRRYVCIELRPEYYEIGKRRITNLTSSANHATLNHSTEPRMPRTRRVAQPAQPEQTDLEDAIKAAKPTPAALLEEYMTLKSWKEQQDKAYRDHMAPHVERLEQINSQLMAMALEQGVNGFSTDVATGYISQGISHKVDPNALTTWTNPDTGEVEVGREALLDWLLANWDSYGAEHAMINIGVDGVRAYMEATKSEEHPEGLLPPGISIERWKSFNIRKK